VAELIEKGFTQIPPGSAFTGYTPPADKTASPGPTVPPPATSPGTPATAPASPAPSPVTPAPLSPEEKASGLGTADNATVKFSDPISRKKS